MKKVYHLSIRCYYDNGKHTQHFQDLKLAEISKWIEAYKFTHPNCKSITVKIWLDDEE